MERKEEEETNMAMSRPEMAGRGRRELEKWRGRRWPSGSQEKERDEASPLLKGVRVRAEGEGGGWVAREGGR